MTRVGVVCLASLLFWAPPAFAKRPSPRRWRVVAWGAVDLTNYQAPALAGADYVSGFNSPMMLKGGVGLLVDQMWYFGMRGEFWKYQRTYTFGGVSYVDKLNYQTLGGEVGVLLPVDSLMTFRFMPFAISFPLTASLTNSNGTYTPTKRALEYEGRLGLGLKFANGIFLTIDAGYRLANLGQLQSGGQAYNSVDYDVSGAFGSLGIFLNF